MNLMYSIYTIIVLLIFIGIGLLFSLFHPYFKLNKMMESIDTMDSIKNKKEDIPIAPLFLTVKKDFLNNDLAVDFCKSIENSGSLNSNSKSVEPLEGNCNDLTISNCLSTNCCVVLNGEKCVSGSQNGPTYLTETDGTKINLDYYYYQGKCFGKKCPHQ